MGNQLAIATADAPGRRGHRRRGGAPGARTRPAPAAALSGVQFAVAGAGGFFTADEMEAAMQPRVYWAPRTSLVCVENTHNRAGGRVFPPSDARAVAERARARGLAAHLDGARIWNASVATGVDVADARARRSTR